MIRGKILETDIRHDRLFAGNNVTVWLDQAVGKNEGDIILSGESSSTTGMHHEFYVVSIEELPNKKVRQVIQYVGIPNHFCWAHVLKADPRRPWEDPKFLLFNPR